MVTHDQIESTVEGFSEPVDAAAFVTEWWENAEGRRLLGEKGGYTVFAVEFWDGCRFFDYTQGRVFERVSELGFGPVEVWRNNFLSEHMGQMAYVVRCEASDLAVTDALELVTRLVVAAPGGMELRGGGADRGRYGLKSGCDIAWEGAPPSGILVVRPPDAGDPRCAFPANAIRCKKRLKRIYLTSPSHN